MDVGSFFLEGGCGILMQQFKLFQIPTIRRYVKACWVYMIVWNYFQMSQALNYHMIFTWQLNVSAS